MDKLLEFTRSLGCLAILAIVLLAIATIYFNPGLVQEPLAAAINGDKLENIAATAQPIALKPESEFTSAPIPIEQERLAINGEFLAGQLTRSYPELAQQDLRIAIANGEIYILKPTSTSLSPLFLSARLAIRDNQLQIQGYSFGRIALPAFLASVSNDSINQALAHINVDNAAEFFEELILQDSQEVQSVEIIEDQIIITTLPA